MVTNLVSRGLCSHTLETCCPACPPFGCLVTHACVFILVKTAHKTVFPKLSTNKALGMLKMRTVYGNAEMAEMRGPSAPPPPVLVKDGSCCGNRSGGSAVPRA